MIRAIVFAVVMMGASSTESAEPSVEIGPSKERTTHSSFDEDHLDLILKQNDAIKDSQYFYSSYGRAHAEIVRDRQGSLYVVLRHGKGRGTHVRSEFITIYKVQNRLNQVSTFPISGPAGVESDWEYVYVIEKPTGGGLVFNLSLNVTGTDASDYPEDRNLAVSVE